jgi:flavin reductase (DIM6/NTAB) family NADH-FMN oxidoreductase RutF
MALDRDVAQSEPMRSLTSDEFRDVIGHFASGVTVITTQLDDRPYGTTASAVSSLSLEPPMLLVCLYQGSLTGQAIARSRRFAVNILTDDQADVAVRFARKDPEKFAGVPIATGTGGSPLLSDALAVLECRVAQDVSAGTHTVFLAEVDHASSRGGTPLAYFRGQFGRLQLVHDEGTLNVLRDRVLNRTIPLDQPLDADRVATGLAVPRGAAFYALSRLAADGLLTRRDDGTFEVIPVTFEIAREALLARATIEMGAGRF